MAEIDIKLKLLGVQKTADRVNRLERNLRRKIMRKAAREAARPIRERATQLVPVDTGRLKRSIKIRAVRRSRRGTVGVNVITGTREELGIAPDATGYYPFSVEYGYTRRDGTTVQERPYMRRALEDEREQALDIFEREMLSGMESELR